MSSNKEFECDEEIMQTLGLDKLLSGLPKLLSNANDNNGDCSNPLTYNPRNARMILSVDTSVYFNGVKTIESVSHGVPPKASRSSESCYPMDLPGYGLVINNKNFKESKERKGTEIDAKGISELLEDLGFVVTLHNDLTADEMKRCLRQAAQKDYTFSSALIVVILTHGTNGVLLGTDDDKVYIKDIEDMFSEYHTLRQKPKIFIIQACRGLLEGIAGSSDALCIDSDETVEKSRHHSTPILNKADFLIAYSTLPDYVSWRNLSTGSLFISSLIAIFRKNANRDHILDMLTKTNHHLSLKTASNNCKQICQVIETLRHKVYFKPKCSMFNFDMVQYS